MYILLILFHSRNNYLALDVAKATILNLFLSIYELIIIAIFHHLRWPTFLAFKVLIIAAIFSFLKAKNKIRLKDEIVKLNLKLNDHLKKPLNLFVLFLLLMIFINSLCNFPLKWDSYSYHLPMAAAFIKTGIFSHYQYYGVSIGSYYPHDIELLYSLIFLANGIEMSSLPNFISLVLIFLGLSLIMRDLLKMKADVSISGSLLFLFLPLTSGYFYEAYVDLYFLSFALFAIYFLIRLFTTSDLQSLFFTLLLMNLMMGTKYQGLSYAFYTILLLCFFILKSKLWQRTHWHNFLIPIFLQPVGCFFYLRNYLLTKNPVFPLDINLLNLIKLRGFYKYGILSKATSLWSTYNRIKQNLAPILFSELSVGLFICLFIWIYCLVNYKTIKQKIIRNSYFYVLLAILVLSFIEYLMMPYTGLNTARALNFSLRLGLIFLAAFFLVSLSILYYSEFKYIIHLCITGAMLLLLSEHISTIKNIFLSFFIITLFIIYKSLRKNGTVFASFLIISCLTIIFLRPEIRKWKNYFYDLKGLPRANLAYAGRNVHFQLFDKHLKYKVVYINVDRNQNLKWNKEKNLDYHKKTGDFFVWLRNIQKEDIDYFVLYELNVDYVEKKWINENPDIFQKELQNVFKINKEELQKVLRKAT